MGKFSSVLLQIHREAILRMSGATFRDTEGEVAGPALSCDLRVRADFASITQLLSNDRHGRVWARFDPHKARTRLCVVCARVEDFSAVTVSAKKVVSSAAK